MKRIIMGGMGAMLLLFTTFLPLIYRMIFVSFEYLSVVRNGELCGVIELNASMFLMGVCTFMAGVIAIVSSIQE